MPKQDYNYFMRLAYEESLKGLGGTHPNPIVGALVVKNNKIVSKGYHLKAGGPHAEVSALDKAGRKAKGADLYVTLEPCCSFGRTPPCTNKIISAGIKRVFIGIKDPNPNNNGRGIKILKKNGIKVKVGFLEDKIKDSNRIFIKYITKKIPFVTVKIAQSLDGKIATSAKESKWITSAKSRSIAHKIRRDFDAVITGANTVIHDDPHFKEAKLKVIVDAYLRTPLKAKIFRSGKVIIAATRMASRNRISLLSKRAEILICSAEDKHVDLVFLLKELAKREISSVLVEAGGGLTGAFFDNCFVDRVLFFIAPKIIGGQNAISSIEGKGVDKINKVLELHDCTATKIGNDLLVEGQIRT